METFQVEILNPTARKILKNLADLKLISIKRKKSFKDIYNKIQQNSEETISMDEITAEVEIVRKARNAKN